MIFDGYDSSKILISLNENGDDYFEFNEVSDGGSLTIKNESIETAAIREVEEECSIFNLTIEKQLITTYHIYFQNKNKLKLTYWFLMNSNYDKPLIPQIEEGITKVEFIKEESIDTILKESYANIRLVYDY